GGCRAPTPAPERPAAGDKRGEPLVCSLRPGIADPASFPRTAWRRAYERALTAAADADFDAGDPAGAFRLRAELSAYLWRMRAARVDVDRILVTAGRTQALSVIAATLRAAGSDAIGVETPGNPAAAECFRWHGVIPVPIRVDGHGLDVNELGRSGVVAALVTPAHQYPTGVVLAPERRRELIAWARRTGGLVIEDDRDAELRYDHKPSGCVQGLAPEQVMLIGSISATLAPALRLGWVVAPRTWCGHLRQARRLADGWGSTLEQLALAEFLAGSAYDRHVRRMRRALRERRDGLITAVRRYLPYGRIAGVSAGLHVLVELPGSIDDQALARRARTAGLDPIALSSLRIDPAGGGAGPAAHWYRSASGLLLGYSTQSPEDLARAVRLLSTCVARAEAPM
ncbi:MAG: PLP-dependent aminotransferase family protein, partial [Micromonosporaceae bacterium]|nr:PLP-dependent aminotransferase family protein [Micromonosporaceae bacterium]